MNTNNINKTNDNAFSSIFTNGIDVNIVIPTKTLVSLSVSVVVTTLLIMMGLVIVKKLTHNG